MLLSLDHPTRGWVRDERKKKDGLFNEADVEMVVLGAEEFDGRREIFGGWCARNRGTP